MRNPPFRARQRISSCQGFSRSLLVIVPVPHVREVGTRKEAMESASSFVFRAGDESFTPTVEGLALLPLFLLPTLIPITNLSLLTEDF